MRWRIGESLEGWFDGEFNLIGLPLAWADIRGLTGGTVIAAIRRGKQVNRYPGLEVVLAAHTGLDLARSISLSYGKSGGDPNCSQIQALISKLVVIK